MKFSPRTVTLLWDVHAWVGILTALVLSTMFFAGSISLFHHDIEAWQDPPSAPGDVASLDTALARLDPTTLLGRGVGAAPPSRHSARAVLYPPDQRPPIAIDPATGAALPERSMVGELFYYLHFLWHPDFPTGMVIAGLFGVLLLLAVVTGVVIHLKDLRRQAFRFRPWLRPRYVWSDLHKVLGVWGLPFQLMIGFTGAVICLAPIVVPVISRATFDGDGERGGRELYAEPPPIAKPSETPGTMLSFVDLTRRARAAVPAMSPTYVYIDRWGRRDARATVYGDLTGGGGFYPGANVVLGAHDGAVVSRSTDGGTPSSQAMQVVYGLHFASYGGVGLKLLYFLLGIGGWLTILSGNWIWLERRARRRDSLGNRLLARLTLGAGGGITIATAAVLWTNRVAAPTAARPDHEVAAFFYTWAAVTVLALVLPHLRRSWAVLLGIAGAGLVLVPVGTVTMTAAPLGGIDGGVAAAGVALLAAAAVAWRHGSATATEVVP